MVEMASAAETAPSAAAQEEEHKKTEHEGQVLHMHTAHREVPLPYFTPQDLKANVQQMTSRLPAVRRKDLLFYGGLGALTVAGALEWPIALAVGGATWVVRGKAKEEAKERSEEVAGSGKTNET
ncbi:hypothetical protein [Streptomyces sp. NPDC059909]|uniref:hypothetical protein n=1 Tax=Streptomyces sp. NPDC059909 TaxID=3346998 RepID=UPI0036573A4C